MMNSKLLIKIYCFTRHDQHVLLPVIASNHCNHQLVELLFASAAR